MAGKGSGFTPSRGMRAEAERALAWRREHGRGGVAVGVARARDLANGRDLSLDTAKRMKSFFARHQVDQKASGWRPGEKGFPSAGRVAWGLWGGDSGKAWANQVVARHDNTQKRQQVRKAAVLAVLDRDRRADYDVVEIAKLSWAQRGQRKNASSRARKAAFVRRHRKDLVVAATTVGLLGSAKLMRSPSARAGLADSFENPGRAMRRGKAAVGATADMMKPSTIVAAAREGRKGIRASRDVQRETGLRQPYIGEGLTAFENHLVSRYKNQYRRRLPKDIAGRRASRGKTSGRKRN